METRDNENPELQSQPTEPPANADQKKPEENPQDTAFTGFDDSGAFVVRVPGAFGYFAIQGHLLEAQAFLRGLMLKQQREQKTKEQIAQASQRVILPGQGGGRFKLFK